MGEAFANCLWRCRPCIIAVAILLFAFSTVLGWSHYGTKAFEYLFGSRAIVVYRVIFIVFILGGATMSLDLAWDLSDTFNGLMAIPNLIGVLSLSPVVCRITKNYVDRKIRRMDTMPMLSAFPDIQEVQVKDLDESD